MMKKVLISIDERLLWRLDEAAKAHGVSRSRFISNLAHRELGGARRSRETQRRIGAAFAELRELGGRNHTGGAESSASIVRAERDGH